MKRFISLLAITLFTTLSVLACNITTTIENKKPIYKVGDEAIVKIKVVLIHKNCLVEIKRTQYKNDGLKIVAGTDWKETSPGIWERKLKIKILETQSTASVKVYRTCKRGGGSSTALFKL
ncbi:MAG: hypothetical protein PHU27_06385 [Salinivirgaceae bacterium]|nr:hypothetical protein [Salinivirgaceae bacterium]MDD4745724.1 hypothetical protein [Salinivirgaceae bacterium]MDY0280041.1 hypothetical protein [Salinivirgaceae bacterium]